MHTSTMLMKELARLFEHRLKIHYTPYIKELMLIQLMGTRTNSVTPLFKVFSVK